MGFLDKERFQGGFYQGGFLYDPQQQEGAFRVGVMAEDESGEDAGAGSRIV